MRTPSEVEFFTEWTDCENCDSIRDSSSLSHHGTETDLANHLNSRPDLEFDRLVVRRLPGNAICLEGTLRVEDDSFDIEDVVKCLAGVDSVINRLSIKRSPCSAEETSCVGEDTVVDW